MPPQPRPARRTSTGTAPQLIAYADRFGGDLHGLTRLLRGPVAGAFGGVHVLPFYVPFDGADAGFDPVDHATVDPRLGVWDDVRDLARTHTVMADLIVNHISARSAAFRDVIESGRSSRWESMFLTLDKVFPDGAREADLAAIFRPRPGLPFTKLTLGGEPRLVWTTFTGEQIDLDLRSELAWDYLLAVIDQLTGSGVTMLRLDAVGYVGKRAGTNCFLTEDTFAILRRLRAHVRERGAQVLLEVHGHWEQQVDLATESDLVYDFALPPLVLHAVLAGDLAPLTRWLALRPANAVTVLDTHDGIGVVDVGTSELRPGVPGLLTDGQIDGLVEKIHDNSGGTSRIATGAAASNLDLYQVNTTFYDAVGADDHLYLLSRLLQLFVPGVPQVYYVGLLAGRNDTDLLTQTGVGRDVNRHVYSAPEIRQQLERPVVHALLAALRLRANHPAFTGRFGYETDGDVLTLRWERPPDVVTLEVNVARSAFTLSSALAGETRTLSDIAALVDLDSARWLPQGAS